MEQSPEEIEKILDTIASTRELEQRLKNALVSPESCKDDRQRLEQIKMIGDAEGSLPLDHRYEPYLEQLFFTPTYAEIEHAWTKFLETLGVDLYALTNLGIAWWYQDRDRSFQAAAVYSHFFRQLEDENLDFVLEEVIGCITTGIREYAELRAMLALEQADGREIEEDLKRRHPVFPRLSRETCRSLIKANTVLLSPFLQGWPELVPFYFQRAIETEFNAKIYPQMRTRMVEQQESCTKCKDLKLGERDSLSMNQFYHWFDQHYSGIFREKFAEPLLVLRHLKKHGGPARHGRGEQFTEKELRLLLNDLGGDNKIFKVFDWMHSPETKTLLGLIIAADKNHC